MMNHTATKRPSLTYFESAHVSPALKSAIEFFNADKKLRRKLLTNARIRFSAFRVSNGFKPGVSKLLTAPGSQPKTDKNYIPTFTLMLAPARTSELLKVNLCPSASKGCEAACLNTAGRGAMAPVQRGRILRTDFLYSHPASFGIILANEILSAQKKYGKFGLRLNCLSDIRFEIISPEFINTVSEFGAIMYDYTAFSPVRRRNSGLPYHLTYSAKETHSVDDIRELVVNGHNVAVPFAIRKGEDMITEWNGMKVIDGDITDFRVDDPNGVIVGLRAKGKGKTDNSGFIREV